VQKENREQGTRLHAPERDRLSAGGDLKWAEDAELERFAGRRSTLAPFARLLRPRETLPGDSDTLHEEEEQCAERP